MSRTYQTEGIVLKAMAMGESDRLLSILTPDRGLIRVIAPGARKPKSKISGSTGLFIQSQMQCLSGRSLDKLLQVNVIHSHPGLGQQLAKLTTAQYWAELTLCQSIEGTADPGLYRLLLQLLDKLETCNETQIYLLLVEGMSLLLHHAGITPQVDYCCRTQTKIEPVLVENQPGVFFSYEDGGVVSGEFYNTEEKSQNSLLSDTKTDYTGYIHKSNAPAKRRSGGSLRTIHRLTLAQWLILCFTTPESNFRWPQVNVYEDYGTYHWLAVEKILRGYAQHHFDRTIRSASLISTVFQR